MARTDRLVPKNCSDSLRATTTVSHVESRVKRRAGVSSSGRYGVARTATSYFRTDVRWPGVSPAGIALKAASPRT